MPTTSAALGSENAVTSFPDLRFAVLCLIRIHGSCPTSPLSWFPQDIVIFPSSGGAPLVLCGTQSHVSYVLRRRTAGGFSRTITWFTCTGAASWANAILVLKHA
jgi:hypothetical protein